MKKIEIHTPFKNHDNGIRLMVNDIHIGTHHGGMDKKFLHPEMWAREMVRKRTKVLDRNIVRLRQQAEVLEWERKTINRDDYI